MATSCLVGNGSQVYTNKYVIVNVYKSYSHMHILTPFVNDSKNTSGFFRAFLFLEISSSISYDGYAQDECSYTIIIRLINGFKPWQLKFYNSDLHIDTALVSYGNQSIHCIDFRVVVNFPQL